MRKNIIKLNILLLIVYLIWIISCDENDIKLNNSYTVVYNANGGWGNMTNSIFSVGVTENLNKNTYLRSDIEYDYKFIGWALLPTGNVEYLDGQSVTDLTSVGNKITLYAVWEINLTQENSYTIIYNANGGTGFMENSYISIRAYENLKINGFARPGYYFMGWALSSSGTVIYTDGERIRSIATAGTEIVLYAIWFEAEVVVGANLSNKFQWLRINSESGKTYILEINADESLFPQELLYTNKIDIIIYLKGIGTMRTISVAVTRTLFAVGNGVTLILDNFITLKGRHDNSFSLVTVDAGGMIIMNDGSLITDNWYYDGGRGGGIFIDGGEFIMNGGEITHNYVSGFNGGGGVFINKGSFIMNDGKISNNSAFTNSSGGGVFIASGTFTMNGGEISGNGALSGGGVYLSNGSYNMNNGKISQNSAWIGQSTTSRGGGIYVGGNFTMSNGEISNNSSTSQNTAYAGGVFVANNGNFSMSGGQISRNNVTVRNGNNAFGGGVYIDNRGSFLKTGGGTIYGYSSSDFNRNTVSSGGQLPTPINSRGHAVYANLNPSKGKEITAFPNDNLIYNGSVSPPNFSGEWDY